MSGLKEIKWIDLPSNIDERGVLTSVECGIDTSFDVKRIFYMHHINADRGGHAHKDTDQVIVPISGGFKVDFLDGKDKLSFEMNDAKRGLYVPRMIFIKLYDFTPGAVCLVLASTHYDINKSMRTWEEYLQAIKK